MMWLVSNKYGRYLLIAIAAIASVNFYLASRDRKTVSRVMETSKREATKDVQTSTKAHSTSLSASSGVQSGYGRD